MHEFDKYLNSIIKNLPVSKNEKAELFDEFRDHLRMLKQDFVNKGMSEDEATNEAIKSFGESNVLKSGLSRNLNKFKTTPNILFGIAFTILLFLSGSRIPVPGMNPEYFASGFKVSSVTHVFPILFTFFIFSVSVFLPLGYFLPIAFVRVGKIRNIVLLAMLLSAVLGVAVGYLAGPMRTLIIASSIFGGVLGFILGFSLLNMINRITYKLSHS